MNKEVTAVLIHMQVFNSLANYLSTKPYGEVKEFFDAFQQSSGVTDAQIEALQKMEEAPE